MKMINPGLSDSERVTLAQAIVDLKGSEAILQFFAFAHLPPHLQMVSAAFANMAVAVVVELPRNPERTVALRKLLEAKDAAVRAVLFK